MQFSWSSFFDISHSLHGRRVFVAEEFLEPLKQLWVFSARELD